VARFLAIRRQVPKCAMKLNTFATVLVAVSVNLTAAAGSALYFYSSPGSWVGQGQALALSSANGDIFLVLSETGFVNVLINSATWNLELGTADGAPFAIGTYLNAQRSGPQPGMPFMEFSGDGRGDDIDTGWFDVLAVTQTGGVITSMAVDFVQYDEGDVNNWVRGFFRYNSAIPVPEPIVSSLFFISILLFFILRSLFNTLLEPTESILMQTEGEKIQRRRVQFLVVGQHERIMRFNTKFGTGDSL
jgi:hypothetical protein